MPCLGQANRLSLFYSAFSVQTIAARRADLHSMLHGLTPHAVQADSARSTDRFSVPGMTKVCLTLRLMPFKTFSHKVLCYDSMRGG